MKQINMDYINILSQTVLNIKLSFLKILPVLHLKKKKVLWTLRRDFLCFCFVVDFKCLLFLDNLHDVFFL